MLESMDRLERFYAPAAASARGSTRSLHWEVLGVRTTAARALIFDFDGLIVDGETPGFQAWSEVYATHGCSLAFDKYSACIGTIGGFDLHAYLAHEAIAFEDSPNGVLAAKRAGIFCVAIPNPLTKDLPFDLADRRLRSLEEFDLDDVCRLRSRRRSSELRRASKTRAHE